MVRAEWMAGASLQGECEGLLHLPISRITSWRLRYTFRWPCARRMPAAQSKASSNSSSSGGGRRDREAVDRLLLGHNSIVILDDFHTQTLSSGQREERAFERHFLWSLISGWVFSSSLFEFFRFPDFFNCFFFLSLSLTLVSLEKSFYSDRCWLPFYCSFEIILRTGNALHRIR